MCRIKKNQSKYMKHNKRKNKFSFLLSINKKFFIIIKN